MDTIASTRAGAYTDNPGPGSWTYRIGTSANWLDNFAYGDVYVISPPAVVAVP